MVSLGFQGWRRAGCLSRPGEAGESLAWGYTAARRKCALGRGYPPLGQHRVVQWASLGADGEREGRVLPSLGGNRIFRHRARENVCLSGIWFYRGSRGGHRVGRSSHTFRTSPHSSLRYFCPKLSTSNRYNQSSLPQPKLKQVVDLPSCVRAWETLLCAHQRDLEGGVSRFQ